MRKILLSLFMFLCISLFLGRAEVSAIGHDLGFHVGTVIYQNELGDIYDGNAGMVGIYYQVQVNPFFGVTLQYDYFSASNGELVITDGSGHTLDRIGTDLEGSLFSITPTLYVRFRPHQIIVPHFGLGLSMYHGEQTFEHSPYLTATTNDFNGGGMNLTAGIAINLGQVVSLQFESKFNFVNVSVDNGAGDTDNELNRIAQFYGGINLTFGRSRGF